MEDGQSEKSSFEDEVLSKQHDFADNTIEDPEKATTNSPSSTGRLKIDINRLPDPVNRVIEVGGESDDVQHYGSSLDETASSSARIEAGPLNGRQKLCEMDQWSPL
jgi:hypothetical protein